MCLRTGLPPVAVALIAAATVGCTSSAEYPRPPRTSSSATTPAVSMTVVRSGDCGKPIGNQDGLLSIAQVSPTGLGSRSAGSLHLDAEGCVDAAAQGVVLDSSCDPAAFPWVASTASRNALLYGLGVRTLRQATFEVGGKPVLRQMILEGGSDDVVRAYVSHAKGCKAVIVASRGRGPPNCTCKGQFR